MKTERYIAGLAGEEAAEQYLLAQGLQLLARRYRAGTGELDLVMQEEETLVFVEVKYRPHAGRGFGLQAVTPAKQRRMASAAAAYLMEHHAFGRSIRFDVVEITGQGILHIPNAFQPQGWHWY